MPIQERGRVADKGQRGTFRPAPSIGSGRRTAGVTSGSGAMGLTDAQTWEPLPGSVVDGPSRAGRGDADDGRLGIEATFAAFVRNANRSARSTQPPARGMTPAGGDPDAPRVGTGHRGDSVSVGSGRPATASFVTGAAADPLLDGVLDKGAPSVPAGTESPAAVPSASPPPLPSRLWVPDVAAVRPPPSPVPERSEGGHIPAGHLDRMISDMMVLVRYGHTGEVRRRLDDLCQRYPEDLLLLRRIAEFHLELGDQQAAIDTLFQLATRLFERRNVRDMRKAIEQVLVLEPNNQRAYKLLGLLSARPATGGGS